MNEGTTNLLTQPDPAVIGNDQIAPTGGFKHRAATTPIDQELVINFRNGREPQRISEPPVVGMSINPQTGRLGYTVHGKFVNGSEFAFPKYEVRGVIDQQSGRLIPIGLGEVGR